MSRSPFLDSRHALYVGLPGKLKLITAPRVWAHRSGGSKGYE